MTGPNLSSLLSGGDDKVDLEDELLEVLQHAGDWCSPSALAKRFAHSIFDIQRALGELSRHGIIEERGAAGWRALYKRGE